MNEIPMEKLESVEGGLTLVETIVTGVVMLVATTVINNWDSFKAGLAGEPDPALTKLNKQQS